MKTVQLFEEGRNDRTQAPLDLLKRCGGYYECPKDANGKRLGPLVGYAGRDENGWQFVGDVYVNFAKAERHAPILKHFARMLYLKTCNYHRGDRLSNFLEKLTGFCGAPEGGKALACQLAQASGTLAEEHLSQYIFPEKKIIALATPTSREVSELVFDRHEPEAGESWWIVEDVCNNFSTTAKLVALIESYGASVAGILCFLNRSPEINEEFCLRPGLKLPVIALVRKKIEQYRQNNPFVAEDVLMGNVVWKPKNEWGKLAAAMEMAAFPVSQDSGD